MHLSKPTTLTAAALAAGLFLLPAVRASAQDAAATPSVSTAAPPPPPRGDRPAFNPDEFRQRIAERLKAQLKVNDEEWSVMQPLLEKTIEKLAATRTTGGGGFGGPGGPGGPEGGRRRGGDNPQGGNQPAATDNKQGGGDRPQRREGGGGGGYQRGGSPETQALRTTLDDDNSTVNDVKAKLQAVRDQRKQSATELAQAREELRKVLNMRQEAALVMDGILD